MSANSAKRKTLTVTGQRRSGRATKRANTAHAAARDAILCHPSTASSPDFVTTASSDWAQLPTELLSLIAGYASFRVLLDLALVNRRLHQLMLRPASDANHVSMWRHYPPVRVEVEERSRFNDWRRAVYRALCIGDDRFGCTHHSFEHVSSLLPVLRHITAARRVHFTPLREQH